jgi:uridine kinase
MTAAATRVLDLLATAPARAGQTRVLAVDGHSGTGKTTLAGELKSALDHAPGRPADVPVVHLDSIYPGWDGLAESIPRLLEWVLEPLAAGRPPRYRRYDWVRNEYAEWVDVRVDPHDPVLIIEGAGAGSLPCAPYLSLLVWLEAPAALRYERAITRDGDGYRPHWQRWADQERRHFAVHDPRARADLCLDTQDAGVA